MRTQLGRETIVTGGAGYRLEVSAVVIDLTEIEATVKELHEPSAEPGALAAALDMWKGDALSDVAWTAVFEPERARIEELRALVNDGYHEVMLRDGRVAESLPDLERAAARTPLRESRQLLLMRSLHTCGRTADALRAGSDYRERLVDQTGLDPSPAYDTLVRSLLADEQPTMASNQAPGQDHHPADIAKAPGVWEHAIATDWQLVGRGPLIHEVDRRLREPSCNGVVLTGYPGVGKRRTSRSDGSWPRSYASGLGSRTQTG